MLHQILIIDNDESKIELYSQYCREYLSNIAIFPAYKLKEAYTYLECPFDLVLCDRRLGLNDSDVADDFIRLYAKKWPESVVVFYSADPSKIKNIGSIRCLAAEAVKGEIIDYSLRTRLIEQKSNTEIGIMKNSITDKQNNCEPKSMLWYWASRLGLVSAVAVMISLGSIKLAAQVGADSINAHIRAIADSTEAHCQIKKDLTTIHAEIKSTDTTLQYVRALLNQMATPAMKKNAQQEFDELKYFRRF